VVDAVAVDKGDTLADADLIFEAVSEDAICKYMKMITLEKLRDSLRDWKFEVEVEPEIAAKAWASVGFRKYASAASGGTIGPDGNPSRPSTANEASSTTTIVPVRTSSGASAWKSTSGLSKACWRRTASTIYGAIAWKVWPMEVTTGSVTSKMKFG